MLSVSILGIGVLVVLLIMGLTGSADALPALMILGPALILTAPCLRISATIDEAGLRICNGFVTRRVDLSKIRGTSSRIGPNLGITTLTWNWAVRRKQWWVILDGGNRVKISVLTELRNEGVWTPVGGLSADEFIAGLDRSALD